MPETASLPRLLGSLATVGALLLLLLLLVWLFQRRLIYLPLDHGVPPATMLLPAARDVRLTTDDGLALGGWLVPPAGSAPPWGGVLVMNGNAGHRGYRAPLADELSRRGLAVLLFDYRGYGENPGRPSEAGLVRDARAARRALLAETGLPAGKLAYFGESLGSGVAVALAAESPPGALVLRSPFTSLADVGRLHYPFLPVRLLLEDRYASVEQIASVRAPLLVIAGEEDRIVPASLSRRLYEAAGEPKRLLLLPGVDHNDYELLAGQRLVEAVVELLRATLQSDP